MKNSGFASIKMIFIFVMQKGMVISTYLEGPSGTAVGSILSIDPAPVSNDIMLAEKKYQHP